MAWLLLRCEKLKLPNAWAFGGIEDVQPNLASGYGLKLLRKVEADLRAPDEGSPLVAILVLQLKFLHAVVSLTYLSSVEGHCSSQVHLQPGLLGAVVGSPACSRVVVHGFDRAVLGHVF